MPVRLRKVSPGAVETNVTEYVSPVVALKSNCPTEMPSFANDLVASIRFTPVAVAVPLIKGKQLSRLSPFSPAKN